jgi:hypothetical protein
MRDMIKFALRVEFSNTAIRTGQLTKVMHQIAGELKPEAAYFFPLRGKAWVLYRRYAGLIADSGYGRTLLPWSECQGRVRPGHVGCGS